ncbi:sigma-70 family RNA polymerase sigma factor [Paenibacillus sp. LX16]|uniref:sigma-70 family RNA polymerase sigma factor n=1 Tax=Paenibacillus sp. LX16 TaxID=1740264 RepID=UPI002E286F9A|nr:sigma-70 family RNA polymerase sigma factor [Paenibacillus sp. LX16]
MNLETLYSSYFNDLYRYLLSLSCNHFIAEELVQETFFRAFLHLEDNEIGNIKAWLFKVGYHAFIDFTRRKNKKNALIEEIQGLELLDNNTPENQFIERDQLRQLIQSIHTLPEKESQAILLCDLHQLKMHEAAEVLGLNLNTLKSHIYRGRKKLKTILEKRGILHEEG